MEIESSSSMAGKPPATLASSKNLSLQVDTNVSVHSGAGSGGGSEQRALSSGGSLSSAHVGKPSPFRSPVNANKSAARSPGRSAGGRSPSRSPSSMLGFFRAKLSLRSVMGEDTKASSDDEVSMAEVVSAAQDGDSPHTSQDWGQGMDSDMLVGQRTRSRCWTKRCMHPMCVLVLWSVIVAAFFTWLSYTILIAQIGSDFSGDALLMSTSIERSYKTKFAIADALAATHTNCTSQTHCSSMFQAAADSLMMTDSGIMITMWAEATDWAGAAAANASHPVRELADPGQCSDDESALLPVLQPAQPAGRAFVIPTLVVGSQQHASFWQGLDLRTCTVLNTTMNLATATARVSAVVLPWTLAPRANGNVDSCLAIFKPVFLGTVLQGFAVVLFDGSALLPSTGGEPVRLTAELTFEGETMYHSAGATDFHNSQTTACMHGLCLGIALATSQEFEDDQVALIMPFANCVVAVLVAVTGHMVYYTWNKHQLQVDLEKKQSVRNILSAKGTSGPPISSRMEHSLVLLKQLGNNLPPYAAKLINQVISDLTNTDRLFSAYQSHEETVPTNLDSEWAEHGMFASAIAEQGRRSGETTPSAVRGIRWAGASSRQGSGAGHGSSKLTSQTSSGTNSWNAVSAGKLLHDAASIMSYMPDLHDYKNMDMLAMAQQTNLPLVAASVRILGTLDVLEKAGMGEKQFLQFMYHIDSGYIHNPYHNSTHGAHVLWSAQHWLGAMRQHRTFAPHDILSLLIAAAVHDYGHPGYTNKFLIATSHPIALEHNDSSPLERYHVAEAFKVAAKMGKESPFRMLEAQLYTTIRASIIELVLATDVACQYEFVARVRSQASAADYDPQHADIMKAVIIVSDIGHASCSFLVHRAWSAVIREEFFRQGDLELSLHLPISPLCNRHDAKPVPDSQIGFLDFVAIPLFNAMKPLLGAALAPHLCQLARNKLCWENERDSQKPYVCAKALRPSETGSGTDVAFGAVLTLNTPQIPKQ